MAILHSTPFSSCRTAFRRLQPTVPPWKRPQVQEVLRPVSLDWSHNRCALTD